MSDVIVSLIRTCVAVWVSAAAVWLADRGIDLPADPATVALTALAVTAYYTAARTLESRWPFIGALLGSSRQPTYSPRDRP